MVYVFLRSDVLVRLSCTSTLPTLMGVEDTNQLLDQYFEKLEVVPGASETHPGVHKIKFRVWVYMLAQSQTLLDPRTPPRLLGCETDTSANDDSTSEVATVLIKQTAALGKLMPGHSAKSLQDRLQCIH
jgi:hypothetical protein